MSCAWVIVDKQGCHSLSAIVSATDNATCAFNVVDFVTNFIGGFLVVLFRVSYLFLPTSNAVMAMCVYVCVICVKRMNSAKQLIADIKVSQLHSLHSPVFQITSHTLFK